MNISLGEICSYRSEKANASSIGSEDLYISTESMAPNKGGISTASSIPGTGRVSFFHQGDTLVSNIRPYFKKIWHADKNGYCSNDILVFQPNDASTSDYLYWLLSGDEFFDYVMATSKGTKMPRGDKSAIMNYAVPSNDETARRVIVSVMSPIQSKIEANTKLNGYLLELLKASAKNLYKEYERNEELELPAGWRWIEVDEISEMVCRGITPKYNPNSDETVLGQTCVRNNLVLLENGRPHSPKKVTEKWLQKYDLLINSTGVGSLGRTAQIWFEPAKLVVDSHVTIVRCKDEKHALYLGFWAFEHEKYIESLHTGSTGQTELPRDHVKAIRLVLPSDESLERFNKMSEPSVRLIAANQEENKRLADLRDALLPKLVSGEIDVSKIDLAKLNSHLVER